MATQAIIAFLVLRESSPRVWGQFVTVSITLSILLHLVGFGNRDYLLQRFALEPSTTFKLWQRNLSSRSPLLVGAALAVSFLLQGTGVWFPLLWLGTGFFAQSVEASILHERRIARALSAELLPAVGLIAWVASHADGLSAARLVSAFAIANTVKALLIVPIGLPSRLKPAARPRLTPSHLAVLRACVPFFLIGLGGMLHSKVDLFLVAAMADDVDLASYQISTNLFIALQATFALLLAPNAKVLQRLPYDTIARLAGLTFFSGTLALAFAIRPMASWVLREPFGLDLPPIFLWVGLGLILPVWVTTLFTYYLLGKERQTSLVYLGYGGALCNAIVTILLLPRLGILGALTGTALASWLTAMGVFWLAHSTQHEREVNSKPTS